jgi:hypothetical protein
MQESDMLGVNLNLTDKAASSLIQYIKRVVVEVVEGDKQVVAYDLGEGETAYRLESKHHVDDLRRQAAKDKLQGLTEEKIRTHPRPLTRGEGPSFA